MYTYYYFSETLFDVAQISSSGGSKQYLQFYRLQPILIDAVVYTFISSVKCYDVLNQVILSTGLLDPKY